MTRLRTRLTALLLLVASLAILGTAFFMLRLHIEDKELYVTEVNSLVAPNVAAALGKSLGSLDRSKPIPPSVFREAFELAGGLPAGVFDTQGHLLAKSAPSVPERIWKIPTEELATAKVVAREIDLLPGQRVFVSFAPIPRVPGTLVAVFAPPVKPTALLIPALKAASGFLIGVFLLAVLLGLLLSAQIARPIEELTEATSQVASGHWKILLHSKPRGEVGKLVRAFSKMVRDLESRERDLKETQAKLVRSESLSALGRFGAGIAHEVKNPLSSILGYAQLLQRERAPVAGKADYLLLIMEETRRASRIITDLLMFARQKPPSLAVHDLRALLADARAKILPQAEELGIELTLESPEKPLEARVDPEQLYQVLLNLCQNAFQAIQDRPGSPGRVQLKLASRGGSVLLEVSDNGPGLSAESLPRLFEPFFSTKEVGKGSGLGLSLCHGIIAQHGGTISADSTQGNGATFRIELPLA